MASKAEYLAQLRAMNRADMREHFQQEIDHAKGQSLGVDGISELLSVEAERFGFTLDGEDKIMFDSKVRAMYLQNVYQEQMSNSASTNNLNMSRFDRSKDDPNKASDNDPFDSTGLPVETLLQHLLDSKGKSLRNKAKNIKPPYMLAQQEHFEALNFWLDKGLTNVLIDRIPEDSEARIILALNFISNVEVGSKKSYDCITLPQTMENSTPTDIKDILNECKRIAVNRPLHRECRLLSRKYNGDHVLSKLRQVNLKKVKDAFSTLDTEYPLEKKLSDFSTFNFKTFNYSSAIRELAMILYVANIISFQDHEDMHMALDSYLDRWVDKKAPGSDFLNQVSPSSLTSTLTLWLQEALEDLSKRVGQAEMSGDVERYRTSKISLKIRSGDTVDYWIHLWNQQNQQFQGAQVKKLQAELASKSGNFRQSNPSFNPPRSAPYNGGTQYREPGSDVFTAGRQGKGNPSAPGSEPLAPEATPLASFDPKAIPGNFGPTVPLEDAGGMEPGAGSDRERDLETKIRLEMGKQFENMHVNIEDRDAVSQFNNNSKYRAGSCILCIKTKPGKSVPVVFQKRPLSMHHGFCGIHGYSAHHSSQSCGMRGTVVQTFPPTFGQKGANKGSDKGKGKGKKGKKGR